MGDRKGRPCDAGRRADDIRPYEALSGLRVSHDWRADDIRPYGRAAGEPMAGPLRWKPRADDIRPCEALSGLRVSHDSRLATHDCRPQAAFS